MRPILPPVGPRPRSSLSVGPQLSAHRPALAHRSRSPESSPAPGLSGRRPPRPPRARVPRGPRTSLGSPSREAAGPEQEPGVKSLRGAGRRTPPLPPPSPAPGLAPPPAPPHRGALAGGGEGRCHPVAPRPEAPPLGGPPEPLISLLASLWGLWGSVLLGATWAATS
uniref:Uncharacterized protein n=1 Tax=Pipistrellus kuhlii TaxID=59472 RepID=A0A7J7ZIS3_PIPKU|nr:hypothetical protein mPipKuh1_009402 [Pipistrellus kuhlii]